MSAAAGEYQDPRELGRLLTFTDGVFAIAVTLLVFAFDVPEGDHEITERVLEQWPNLLAYFLSFAVIGRFWIVHHRLFATLQQFDRRLVSLNLVYLSLVVLVPFTTELLGNHGNDAVSPMVYAAVLGTAGLVNWVMVRHAVTRGHVRADAREATASYASSEWLLAPAVFFASIPMAFLSTVAAELMWIGLIAVPLRQRTRARSSATSS